MTTRDQRNPTVVRIEGLLTEQRDLFKDLLRETLQEVLEGEMTELLGAAPGERHPSAAVYRAGYYSRGLVTRVGKLALRVPRDRDGRFSTALFERYQRPRRPWCRPWPRCT